MFLIWFQRWRRSKLINRDEPGTETDVTPPKFSSSNNCRDVFQIRRVPANSPRSISRLPLFERLVNITGERGIEVIILPSRKRPLITPHSHSIGHLYEPNDLRRKEVGRISSTLLSTSAPPWKNQVLSRIFAWDFAINPLLVREHRLKAEFIPPLYTLVSRGLLFFFILLRLHRRVLSENTISSRFARRAKGLAYNKIFHIWVIGVIFKLLYWVTQRER